MDSIKPKATNLQISKKSPIETAVAKLTSKSDNEHSLEQFKQNCEGLINSLHHPKQKNLALGLLRSHYDHDGLSYLKNQDKLKVLDVLITEFNTQNQALLQTFGNDSKSTYFLNKTTTDQKEYVPNPIPTNIEERAQKIQAPTKESTSIPEKKEPSNTSPQHTSSIARIKSNIKEALYSSKESKILNKLQSLIEHNDMEGIAELLKSKGNSSKKILKLITALLKNIESEKMTRESPIDPRLKHLLSAINTYYIQKEKKKDFNSAEHNTAFATKKAELMDKLLDLNLDSDSATDIGNQISDTKTNNDLKNIQEFMSVIADNSSFHEVNPAEAVPKSDKKQEPSIQFEKASSPLKTFPKKNGSIHPDIAKNIVKVATNISNAFNSPKSERNTELLSEIFDHNLAIATKQQDLSKFIEISLAKDKYINTNIGELPALDKSLVSEMAAEYTKGNNMFSTTVLSNLLESLEIPSSWRQKGNLYNLANGHYYITLFPPNFTPGDSNKCSIYVATWLKKAHDNDFTRELLNKIIQDKNYVPTTEESEIFSMIMAS